MASTARDSKITCLTGICKNLAARVEILENEIAQLKVRLSNFEEEDIGGAMVDEEEAKARVFGRPSLKDRGQMELDRDQILSFLSSRWIEISQLLATSTTANELQTGFFENYIDPKLISHRGLDILFNNAGSLFLFINDSNRYQGDAIEIASAMAGVPEMEPRSSYDYFLAKKNRNQFKAQQFGAMTARTTRVSRGKRRKPKVEPSEMNAENSVQS